MSASGSDPRIAGLSAEDFVKVFPFFLSWDQKWKLESWGPSLEKICQDLSVGEPVAGIFELVRPEGEFGPSSFECSDEVLYLFSHRFTGTRFRGQVLSHGSDQGFVMLCSPWVQSSEELEELGITFADFAIHDSTLDQLQMLQTQQMVNADLRLQAKRLSEQRAILRQSELEARKLALVAARTDNGVIVTDSRGSIEWVNDAFSRMTGWSLEDSIGRTPDSILHGPGTDPEVVDYMKGRLAQGKGFVAEVMNYHKCGRPYWVSIEGQPIEGEDGKVSNYMAIQTDITQRRRERLERDLQFEVSRVLGGNGREIETLEKVLGVMTKFLGWTHGVAWKVDGDFQVVAGGNGVPDKGLADFISRLKDFANDPTRLPNHVLSVNETRWVEIDKASDQSGFYQSAKQIGLKGNLAFPILAGENVGYVLEFFWESSALDESIKGFLLPIVEGVREQVGQFFARKQIESDVLRAKEEAEAASRTKGEFLATMSHEIRTPMNGIMGMASMLLDDEVDGGRREMANSILSSGEALVTLIDDILDFSKIEAGRLEVVREDISLDNVVDGVVDLLFYSAEEKGVEMSVLIDPDVPQTIESDPGRLRQILLNLIGNAIKFTDEGEVILSITRGAATTDGEMSLDIEVEDTGIGMSESQLARLFIPFSQVDSSSTRRYGGTGLGLAISKRLAELMNGSLSVESRPDCGSKFILSLPVGPSRPSPEHDLREIGVGLRIMVVDETSMGGRAVALALAGLNHPPLLLTNEADGVRELSGRRSSWDFLVVSSSQFGDPMQETLSFLREEGRCPKVILVGSVLESEGVRDHLAEVDSFLFRPLRRIHLKSALRGEIGGEPSRREFSSSGKARRSKLPHMLIVEDNDVNSRVAIMYLEKLGLSCQHALDGDEAVEKFEEGIYDGILMDCHMPIMDGYEATRKIRELEARSDWDREPIHIVAMTANVFSGQRERCLAAGMNDYLSKPLRLAQLATALSGIGSSENQISGDDNEVEMMMDSVSEAISRLKSDLDRESAIQLVERWLDDAPARILEVENLAGGDNQGDLRRAVHSLKGSAALFGLHSFKQLCGDFEELASAGDKESQRSLVQELRESYEDAASRLWDEHSMLEGET